uniref:EF-hand domain-containing protein n=1 Tax=Magallana gigas TaxID=29159 RepID=A0A8W8P059_MAGGI
MNSPEDHETKFFKAEFNAIVNKRHGSLTMDEYINLFKFLQYGDKCEIVERDRSKNITIEQHLSYMNHPGVRERTSRQRDIFMKFADGNDTATREQILQSYEQEFGDEFTEEHRGKINNLPIDGDGKVTYEVFLRNYLLERGQAVAGPSC